ncbi:MAG: hypothetical protein GTO14_08980 [Anaerolineales bacterium]|nr:hypothetical protein [Anaerolineales bacterium]
MRNAIALAKIFGIEIRVDLTWMLAFGAILWSLGSYYFPSTYPELSTIDVWTLAIAVTTFLYVSIAAHELGHSLVSTRLGVPVTAITLFIFGGLAQMAREPRRARDEFFIAIAGPVVSLLLALGFGALSWAGPDAVGLKLAAFGRWMGIANLSLMLFNLIPGFPLDGGRVLRAFLWGMTGNFERSTKIAGFFGQVAAFGLMGWGALQILNGHLANGFWIVLVGWFLQNASVQSAANAALKAGLSGLKVREIMRNDGPAVPPSMTLERLLNEIAIPSGREWFPVSGGTQVTGVITLKEIKAIKQEYRGATTVGMAMKSLHELPAVHPDEGVYEAFEQMVMDNLSQLHVSENGNWMGVVTRESILATWRLRSKLGGA